jgi:hypothetical protein
MKGLDDMNEWREEREYAGVPFRFCGKQRDLWKVLFFGLLNLKRTAARTKKQVKRRPMGGLGTLYCAREG